VHQAVVRAAESSGCRCDRPVVPRAGRVAEVLGPDWPGLGPTPACRCGSGGHDRGCGV